MATCLYVVPTYLTFVLKIMNGDLPGGPVAQTLRSQRRGPGLGPWLGN